MEKLRLHYKPHDMRYTFGSLLLYFTGGNLTYVSEQMGHSSIDMLAEAYARTVKENEEGTKVGSAGGFRPGPRRLPIRTRPGGNSPAGQGLTALP